MKRKKQPQWRGSTPHGGTFDELRSTEEIRTPGLYTEQAKSLPQVTEVNVASCALHSQSKGWFPFVQIDLKDETGATYQGVMAITMAAKVSGDLLDVAQQAQLDIEAHIRELRSKLPIEPGTGKSHRRT